MSRPLEQVGIKVKFIQRETRPSDFVRVETRWLGKIYLVEATKCGYEFGI